LKFYIPALLLIKIWKLLWRWKFRLYMSFTNPRFDHYW